MPMSITDPARKAQIAIYQRGYRAAYRGAKPSELGQKNAEYMRGYTAGQRRRDQTAGRD